MKPSLIQSPLSQEILLKVRQFGEIQPDELLSLDANDRAYFIAELSVRKAEYQELESRLPIEADEWVTKFCICYRDLFTNPKKALHSLEQIIEDAPTTLNFPLRLKFWHAHLLFMTGKPQLADEMMVTLRSYDLENHFWKSEALAILALGHYFAGRTKESLIAHKNCQKEINRTPDLFIQTFNAAMATRAALKSCDAKNFEYFSQILESSLIQHNDSRYRLRHIGYRALILNQLGEHSAAEQHWTIGDGVLHETQSELERGQYKLYRGLSYALNKEFEKASLCFKIAQEELIAAGSPPEYIAELEIAKRLAPIANPLHRGASIKHSFETATSAAIDFSILAEKNESRIKNLYSDALLFCDELISGAHPNKRSKEFCSIVISIIDNVTRSKSFVSGISHFRLIPNFIESMKQTGITESGISDAIESVLRIRPNFKDNHFELPTELESVAESPEIKNTLEFASSLCELGKHADRLFKMEAHLKETERATHLLHDLRFFASELSRAVKTKQPLQIFEKLDSRLHEHLDGYLNSLKTGHTLDAPGIINVSELLESISSITHQMTGKKFEFSGDLDSFIWASEPLLQRLLINLIKNGIEAGSGECPVSVEVSCDENEISFAVQDNGFGISPAALESMIDHSHKTAVSTKQDGIGLGLRSAYDCANSINADIKLTSSNEKGTQFTVTLEIPKPSSDHFQTNSYPEILVIDDSRAVRESWEAFGEINLLNILPVSPKESVFILNQNGKKFKWVVLDYDLKLPNCNGADLAEPIKKLGAKVALSSGYQIEELPEQVVALPWNAILSKEPQNPEMATSLKAGDIGLRRETFNSQSRTAIHDIRNELTPIKTLFQILKSRNFTQEDKINKHINIFGRSLETMENIIHESLKEKA